MRLPHLEDGNVDLEASVPLLRRGIDLGINYIDSAYVYIKGTSEVAVGRAIQGYDRAGLHLATKIPSNREEDAKSAVWRAKLEESLQRFDTPYIDFILFHSLTWEAFTERVSKPGMALEAARKAQDEGLVRHICFSSHDAPDNIIRLVDTGAFAGMLVQYNFLARDNEPAIARAGERGMGVAIMGPVAGGRLATPQGLLTDQEGAPAVKTPELALRFVWNSAHVSVALSGMNEMEQVEENAAAAARAGEMSSEDNAQIQALIEQNQKLADLYCTGCGYCMPCPNGVNIPENFRYMNWYRVWGLEQQATDAYAKLSDSGTWGPWAGRIEGLKAEACVHCGECEAKCPQNIPIIDQLEQVAETLGE
jgi:predicted aldo/keto reductase-like oxidoreductase